MKSMSGIYKNCLPHKSLLVRKTPIELFLPNSPVGRSTLRPFGQKVKCFNYEVTDKLSARGYEGRIIGYPNTFQTYWVLRHNRPNKAGKKPQSIQPDSKTESEDEILWSASDKMLLEPETPVPETEIPEEQELDTPVSGKEKKKKDWGSIVGTREKSTRERKTRVLAVGADPDHLTDEQARNSSLAAKWAKARAKERAQLEKYGVFTKVNKLSEGVKAVDAKWVYIAKRRLDGSIEKYKARKVGQGFTRVDGVSYDSDQTYA